MAKDKIYSAIDLGSQTIRAAIGRLLEDGSLEVIGYGTASSEGIVKGRIEDANAAQEAVKKAVLAAENDVKARLPFRMEEVAASVTGSIITGEQDVTTVSNNAKDGKIGEKLLFDIDSAFEERFTHKDRKPIHIYVTEYNVDNVRETSQASVLEMQGEKIGAKGFGILGDLAILDKIAGTLNNAGHTVDIFCFDVVADGYSILTPEQRQIGSIIINAGAGSTDFAFWKNGIVQFIGSFPVGGDHITNDLALGLNMPFKSAEELKCQYDKNETEVRVGGKLYKTRSVDTIVQARTEETVRYIADQIKQNGMLSQIQGGIFLTGNAARSSFISYMRREFSSLEVRNVYPIIPAEPDNTNPEEVGRLFSPYYGNKFQTDSGSSTILGMLAYAAKEDLHTTKKSSSGIFKFFNIL